MRAFWREASSARSPISTLMPWAIRAVAPPPASGFGSATAAITSRTPALMSAAVQGGCFPWWLQGSRVTRTCASRRPGSRGFQRRHLGVPLTELGVKPFPDQLIALEHHRADQRIRCHPTPPIPGEFEGPAHCIELIHTAEDLLRSAG